MQSAGRAVSLGGERHCILSDKAGEFVLGVRSLTSGAYE